MNRHWVLASEMPASLAAVTAEHPRVRVERMDVADIASVHDLARKLAGVPIDVLINNAGVYSDRMIEQIEKITIADTGRFIQYDGATAPW
jgi:NAD(P)-dependent dehydrogenase (short-subunit alcohol dehydrogenase family)